MRVAIVLASGESRRFGGDKLLALADGEPVLRRVDEAIEPLVDEVYLAARSVERCRVYRGVVGVEAGCLPDPDMPCAGPAAPAVTAAELGARMVLFAPGDAPWLTRESLEALLNLHSGYVTSVLHNGGMLEPLLFIANGETLERIAEALRLLCRVRGKLKPTDVHRLVDRLVLVGSAMITYSESTFAHANTPIELRARIARNRLSQRTLLEMNPHLAKLLSESDICKLLAAEAQVYAQLGLRHLYTHALADMRLLGCKTSRNTNPSGKG